MLTEFSASVSTHEIHHLSRPRGLSLGCPIELSGLPSRSVMVEMLCLVSASYMWLLSTYSVPGTTEKLKF